jgi:hypothetical protein
MLQEIRFSDDCVLSGCLRFGRKAQLVFKMTNERPEIRQPQVLRNTTAYEEDEAAVSNGFHQSIQLRRQGRWRGPEAG